MEMKEKEKKGGKRMRKGDGNGEERMQEENRPERKSGDRQWSMEETREIILEMNKETEALSF